MRMRWERDENEMRMRWEWDENEMRMRWEWDEMRMRWEWDENEMRTSAPCRRGEAPPQYMCLRQRISSHASCGLFVRMILMVFSRIFVRKIGTEIYITTRLALRLLASVTRGRYTKIEKESRDVYILYYTLRATKRAKVPVCYSTSTPTFTQHFSDIADGFLKNWAIF